MGGDCEPCIEESIESSEVVVVVVVVVEEVEVEEVCSWKWAIAANTARVAKSMGSNGTLS